MPTLLLIRHGENDFVKTHKMAGRLAGVHLNQNGRKQAEALAEALKSIPLRAVVSSPLERALETAHPIAQARKLEILQEPDLIDVNIGQWQGKSWRRLALTKDWKIVQNAPSRFRFPGGESFTEAQARCVNAIERIVQKYKKPKDTIAIIFHADPIKLVVAHFLGMPLDHFQRLGCDTGSATILRVSEAQAYLVKMNQRPPFDLPRK
ncbi:MAG: histidine phosphatase family protein [Anaerolineaceae bacterium]|jgi:probable phosphoglycerate mutase|nr:histidine phosphatase family protein [Anaerolineaceae bacterium]OQY88580.1 MAG: hypothetical protein B6D38_09445 [Anaerolineae bacterium UTCFX1]